MKSNVVVHSQQEGDGHMGVRPVRPLRASLPHVLAPRTITGAEVLLQRVTFQDARHNTRLR